MASGLTLSTVSVVSPILPGVGSSRLAPALRESIQRLLYGVNSSRRPATMRLDSPPMPLGRFARVYNGCASFCVTDRPLYRFGSLAIRFRTNSWSAATQVATVSL